MSAPTIFLPPRVARELAQRTLSFRADVLASIDLDDTDPVLREFTARLQAIDPRVIMVRAKPKVVPGVPMAPGYYHLLIDNGTTVPITVTVIEGEHGEFVQPTSRVLDKLAAGDLRQDRTWRRFDATRKLEAAAIERERVHDREERIDHRRDLVNAYTRTSVSTTEATPWRQNQAGHNHQPKGAR
jgi:hypothetical protein